MMDNPGKSHSFSARLGYHAKLFISLSLISILVFGVLTLNRVMLMRASLEERTTNRINSLGNILTEDLSDDYRDKNYTNLREGLTLAAEQPGIRFVSVISTGSIVLYSSNPDLENKKNIYADCPTIKYNQELYIKSFPMSANGTPLTIQIAFSLESISRDILLSFIWATIIGVSGIFLILLTSWYMTVKLLSPLEQMKIVAQQFADGNFSVSLSGTSNDIIGELENSLNRMAQKLETTNRTMKSAIKEAVSKYEAANRELQDKSEKLKEVNKKLIEADKLKTEFVSIVSHELRTPLTSIIGFAKILLTLKLSDEQKEKYLKVIEAEGKRLSSLVNDFLDITKIESRTITFKPEEFDMRDIINEIQGAFNLEGDIKIETHIPATPMMIYADRDKIKQVFTNLLANAVRYTPEKGKITITVEKENGRIKISIHDEGPGIKNDDIKKIFDKFYRSDDDISKKNRGSGLGLAITRGIISQHKGEIWAESESGKGSTFVFTLPVNN